MLNVECFPAALRPPKLERRRINPQPPQTANPKGWKTVAGGRAQRHPRNAKKNTPNTARIEHDKALAKVMLTLLKDDTQVYKQFVENESFHRFVTDMVFDLTHATE